MKKDIDLLMDEKGEAFLSIWCLSYNFKEYIRETFEGFLRQEVNFRYRVFVFDDASSDGTSDIIREYISRYPDIFEAVISETNTYRNSDRNQMIEQLRERYQVGKYIAECEGDDYWTDPYKLQKQVDFLESHPECSLTVHAAHWINYETNREYDVHPYESSRYLTPEEVITQPGGNPPTASYVYRREDLIVDPAFHVKDIGDYTRQLYELSKGKIYYFDEVMSVYRHRHPGSWSSKYKQDTRYAAGHFFGMQSLMKKYDEYTKRQFHTYVDLMYRYYLLDPMLRDLEYSMDEYYDYLQTAGLSSESSKKLSNERDRIGRVIRGTYLFSDEEVQLLNSMKHRVIYGCGDYSRFIVALFNNSNMSFDGYIISDSQGVHEPIDGKPVWRLQDYPYKQAETTVIIGVGQNLELVVLRSLKQYGIEHILKPLWFESSNEGE